MLSVQLKTSQNDIESRLKNKDPLLKGVEWFDWIGLFSNAKYKNHHHHSVKLIYV
jgi:hypothetical protein